jgi:hypothetical protein
MVKKQFLILLLCLSVITTCKNPAAPQLEAKFGGNLTFQTQFQPTNDPVAAISGFTLTKDGGYAMIGYTGIDPSLSDTTNDLLSRSGLFVKTTALGVPRIVQSYNALSCSFLVLTAFEQTADEGYIAVGYTNNAFNLSTSVGMFMMKMDVRGNQQWIKRLDEPYIRRIAKSIHQTNDGGYIIAGDKNTSGDANDDMMVIKTDAMGNVQWERVIDGPGVKFPNHANAVRQTKDGGYIVAGSFGTYDVIILEAAAVYKYYGPKIALVKLDASGNQQWAKLYPASTITETGEASTAYDVLQTDNGDYVLTGYTRSTNISPTQMVFMRISNLGGFEYQQLYDPNSSEGHAIARTSDGGFIINGVTNKYYSGYMYAVKTDSLGVSKWAKQFGTSGIEENGIGVQQTIDGGYILAGTVLGNNIHLVKTDSLGNFTTTQ